MNEIKGDVQRMVKRRKDSGFTLIELMIVIAVIGILAVVLVPKFNGVKDTARTAGIETNMRQVQTYVVSQIDKWRVASANQATVAADINAAIGNDIKDPYNNSSAGFSTSAVTYSNGTFTNGTAGKIHVNISGSGASYTVSIVGFDNNGKQYKYVDVTP